MTHFIYPFISTALIGCCGILPYFPYKYVIKHSSNDSFVSLKLLAMYFATGCLVSEIFLHLLPEIWQIALSKENSLSPRRNTTKPARQTRAIKFRSCLAVSFDRAICQISGRRCKKISETRHPVAKYIARSLSETKLSLLECLITYL